MGHIYFAHPINTYSVPIEDAAIALIMQRFPTATIENPNKKVHQKKYEERQKNTAQDRDTHKAMDHFYEVLLACDGGVVALTFLDGRIGLGVAGETRRGMELGLPVWGMFPDPTLTIDEVVKRLPEFIQNPTCGLFTIRDFTENERRQLAATEAKPLVVDHQDTRLRSFKVYKGEKRLYAESHLVETSVPEGFYPKE